MEKDSSSNAENRFDIHLPPREDRYQYYNFTPENHPAGVLLAKQIQAQSYVEMRIVRPEALLTLPDGSQIISPDATNPSGVMYEPPEDSYIEYTLGVRKGTTDPSPTTGDMVAWKKLYTSLDGLPEYQFCKDDLSPESERYLREIDANPHLTLVEPEALGKTLGAGGGAIKEFIRNEVQRAYGKGEIWFMGLVEKTVYQSWVHNWGPSAIRRIGDSKNLPHPMIVEDVALVPTIVDIDNFYANMVHDIKTSSGKDALRKLVNFLYMAEGLSDVALGEEIATFRVWAEKAINWRGSDE